VAVARGTSLAGECPDYGSTFEHSAAILAAFTHTIRDLPESCRQRAINVPEVGIDPELFRPAETPRQSERVRFLFAGRLVPYKLPDLLVECFEKSPLLRQHGLTIAGEGPERERIEARIAAANLEHCVTLVGHKTQAEVGELMPQSDVFAFPSIRELGAGVVAEAMASGLCCVAVDYGGPAELLADGRGLKVSLGSRSLLTQGFVDALERLAQDRGLSQEMGARARDYALAKLSWSVKAQRIVDVYRAVVIAANDARRRRVEPRRMTPWFARPSPRAGASVQ
jgi:glycosyltransferase involved in cell wall biosynthesis